MSSLELTESASWCSELSFYGVVVDRENAY